jgi:hypothetical protein
VLIQQAQVDGPVVHSAQTSTEDADTTGVDRMVVGSAMTHAVVQVDGSTGLAHHIVVQEAVFEHGPAQVTDLSGWVQSDAACPSPSCLDAPESF